MSMVLIEKDELLNLVQNAVNTAVAEASKVKAPTYYTNKQAAKLLNVSVSTLDRWRKNGTLRYFQQGGTIIIPDYEINRMLYNGKFNLNGKESCLIGTDQFANVISTL